LACGAWRADLGAHGAPWQHLADGSSRRRPQPPPPLPVRRRSRRQSCFCCVPVTVGVGGLLRLLVVWPYCRCRPWPSSHGGSRALLHQQSAGCIYRGMGRSSGVPPGHPRRPPGLPEGRAARRRRLSHYSIEEFPALKMPVYVSIPFDDSCCLFGSDCFVPFHSGVHQ
jgi:hypothetical protein